MGAMHTLINSTRLLTGSETTQLPNGGKQPTTEWIFSDATHFGKYCRMDLTYFQYFIFFLNIRFTLY
jgi:hypothetical protein